jgi:hypothetical protein
VPRGARASGAKANRACVPPGLGAASATAAPERGATLGDMLSSLSVCVCMCVCTWVCLCVSNASDCTCMLCSWGMCALICECICTCLYMSACVHAHICIMCGGVWVGFGREPSCASGWKTEGGVAIRAHVHACSCVKVRHGACSGRLGHTCTAKDWLATCQAGPPFLARETPGRLRHDS